MTKPTGNIILNGKHLKQSHEIRKETGLPITPLLFTAVLEALTGWNKKKKKKKENKGIQTGKDVVKVSLFADDILHSRRQAVEKKGHSSPAWQSWNCGPSFTNQALENF